MAIKKVRPDRRYKKPWELSFYGTDKKRRYEYFDTKGEARDREIEIERKKRGGGIVAPSAQTFRVFADRYVEVWKLGKIRGKRRPKPSTQRGYDYILKNHLYPAFGAGRVQVINRDGIENLEESLALSGRSLKTRRNVLNVLSAILDHAVRERLREDNPAFRLNFTMPDEADLEWGEMAEIGARMAEENEAEFIAPLDEKTAAAYTNCVLARYKPTQPIRAFLVEALWSGKRRGEMHGGRWCDYDFGKNPEVRVRQALDERAGVIPPKSRNGFRTIPLPRQVAQAIQEWRLVCPDRSPEAIVYLNPRTGKPMGMTNAWKRHQTVCKLIDIPPFKLHALRGVYASLMAQRGMDSKTLAYLMGHGDERVTAKFYKKATRDGLELGRKIISGS